MSGLLDDPAVRLSDRDFRAWTSILDRMARQEDEAHEARLALAYELGFDTRRPSDIMIGDRVRHHDGCYYAIRGWTRHVVDPETDYVEYTFRFQDSATALVVDANERLTVAMPADEDEPF